VWLRSSLITIVDVARCSTVQEFLPQQLLYFAIASQHYANPKSNHSGQP
jgi:hypothetical protein